MDAFAADMIIVFCFVSQRKGADYSVYVNTAGEFDGCDSGASPDEAVSWGKISSIAKPVKVFDIKFLWLCFVYDIIVYMFGFS